MLWWPRSGGGSVLLGLELVVSRPKECGSQLGLAPDGSSTWKGFVQGLQESAGRREEITFNPTKERGSADLAALTT